MPKTFPLKIDSQISTKISIKDSGLYAISITATCKGKNDLKVEIDEKSFREVPPEKDIQTYNIPPAWNGTKLKGKFQTNIFLLQLKAGEHNIAFIPDGQAEVRKWDFWQISDSTKIEFALKEQSETGDRRPWFTFALIDLPFKSITAEASVDWHLFDGDDVKLVIDNQIERNPQSRLWRYWLWHATPLQLFTGTKTEHKTIDQDLTTGTHYIEFWADKTPTLHTVVLDLGDLKTGSTSNQSETKPVPTVDNPKWTEDFSDDTDQMILARLIFGEGRNQSREAMVGIGWVIKNRIKAHKKYFGYDYHEIILKNDETYWQFSSFMPSDANFIMLTDPLSDDVEEANHDAWFVCYEVASDVISGSVNDPTQGATFFHSSDLSQESFTTKSVPGAIFTKRINNIFFYRDPNDS